MLVKGGAMGRAAVPSGACTGVHEAVELGDDDLMRIEGSLGRIGRVCRAQSLRAMSGAFDITAAIMRRAPS